MVDFLFGVCMDECSERVIQYSVHVTKEIEVRKFRKSERDTAVGAACGKTRVFGVMLSLEKQERFFDVLVFEGLKGVVS